MEQASTGSKRTIPLRGTKALTVGWPTRARNREREEEEGGREEEEEERGSALSGWKEAKEGKRERGEGLKKAPQHKVKCPPLKGGPGGAHKAAIGQTRWLKGFLIEHLLEWAF